MGFVVVDLGGCVASGPPSASPRAEPAAPDPADAGLRPPVDLASPVLEDGDVVADPGSDASDGMPMEWASSIDPLDASVPGAASYVLPAVDASVGGEARSALARVGGVLGSPADVRTRPGTFNGYWVGFGCSQPSFSARWQGFSTVIVLGKGARAFPGDDAFARLAGAVRGAARAPSVFATSGWDPCYTAGQAIRLSVNDYRDVDAMIHRIGAWLARQDYGGEVQLDMAPKPTVGPHRPPPRPLDPTIISPF